MENKNYVFYFILFYISVGPPVMLLEVDDIYFVQLTANVIKYLKLDR